MNKFTLVAYLQLAFIFSSAINQSQTLVIQAHSAPTVSITGADSSKLYTVVCTDPDPPDPAKPVYREWLHWLVTNIPGATPDTKHGTEVTKYM